MCDAAEEVDVLLRFCGRDNARRQGPFGIGTGWDEQPRVQKLSQDGDLLTFATVVCNWVQFLHAATQLYWRVWADRGLRQLPLGCGLFWFGDVSDGALVALRFLMWRKAPPGEAKFITITPPRLPQPLA